MKKRSFGTVKRQKDLKGFNKFCIEIIKAYSKSGIEFSQTYYCNRYDISKDCFGRMRDYVIVTGLISEEMAIKVKEKAIKNQQMHAKNAGAAVESHYYDLFRKRYEFLAFSFPTEKVKIFAERFANEVDVSMEKFASEFDISVKVLGILLRRSIVENIVDDNTFEKIMRRSIKKSKYPEDTRKAFEKIKELREENSKSHS